MNPLTEITNKEYEKLLLFPVYISLLAANMDGRLDEKQKRTAIKFAHIKTYTCDPMFEDYYLEADKEFESNIESLDNELPKDKKSREKAIKKELLDIEKIVTKLGDRYIDKIHKSMDSFKEHVLKAHHSIFMDFLMPVPISGLNDR